MVHPSPTRAFLAASILLAAGVAQATTLTQARSFDLTSPFVSGQGGNADLLLFDRFDPALGTLSTVEITIDGTIRVNGAFPTSFFNSGIGGIVPVPYTYTMSIQQDFGLGFLTLPEVIFSGNLPGGTFLTPFDFTTLYGHSFTYTSTTDLVGFAPVATTSSTLGAPLQTVAEIPPAFANGARGDFVSPIPGVVVPWLAIPEYAFTVIESAATGQVVGTIRSSGTLTVTYDFIETAAVPEPAGWSLLVVSVLGATLTRRRKPHAGVCRRSR